MQLPFSLFLAVRFIKPKRTFLSVITVVSVLGVTLGIAVMIVVISVMNGFDRELRSKVLGFDSHISVTDGGIPFQNWRAIPKLLTSQPNVLAAAPYARGPVLLSTSAGNVRAAQIRGIDPSTEGNVQALTNAITAGNFDLTGDSTVMGEELAKDLDIRVGDKITVYPARDFGPILDALNEAESSSDPKTSIQKIRALVLPAELTVKGLVNTGRYPFDSNVLLAPIHIAQELYSLGDSVHGVSAWLKEPDNAPAFAQEFVKILPGGLRIPTTWIDDNRGMFDAIRTEKITMFFLLLFIVIVAAFSIMNTLITVTVMKTREIGVMKALGATRTQIVWVFLTQGMIVGIFGNVIGLSLGLSILRWRNEFKDFLTDQLGIPIFSKDIYQFSKIPSFTDPSHVAVICTCAFLICSLAALLPALVAARLDPVKALRHD